MYAFIEGKVCEKTASCLVIEAGGVGYQLVCSMNTVQSAPPLGETMRCHTYLAVREDAMELFGFATREEKELFLQLISVSGVGTRTALALLGSMPVHDLLLAIMLDDVNSISRAPGIGKKTAQRIALELKDKVAKNVSAGQVFSAEDGKASDTAGAAQLGSDAVQEAMEALMALGYSGQEARSALSKVRDRSDKPEELIRLSLREMSSEM